MRFSEQRTEAPLYPTGRRKATAAAQFCTNVRLGRSSDPAGRNVSELRAGLERTDVDADPPPDWGRLVWTGKQSTGAPVRSTGAGETACREGGVEQHARSRAPGSRPERHRGWR